MSTRWIARGVAAGTALAVFPAAAFAAGGEILPFNQAFDTITSNLTGPTAKAVIIAAFFVALFATFFFLSDGQRIRLWVVRIFPRAARRLHGLLAGGDDGRSHDRDARR